MFGSVCSGIEAASVAWGPLGWKAAWFAEIEPFPSAVLAHRFPDVENLGDMRSIPSRVLNGSISAPDVLTGGTPCQSFSVAGMREGLDDPRGALTIKFVEIADAIDHVRTTRGDQPAIVVWENVPGVLSDKGNAFGCFLGALVGESEALEPAGGRWTDAGCVYGPARSAAWRVLDAQYFGLAQRRRRVFVVASARTGFDPAAVLFEFEGVRRDSPPRREAREVAAGDSGAGAAAAGTLRSTDGGADVDHAMAGHIVAAFGQNRQSGPVDVSHALNAHAGPAGRLDFESETFLVQSVHGTQDPIIGNDCAHALGRNNGQENAVYSVALRGRDGGSIAELGGNTATALRASTGGGDKAHVLSGLAVRRLTPRECERLQGFPDDWTLVPHGTNRAKDFHEWLAYLRLRILGLTEEEARRLAADGPRYKAIGNSWAVPCARWVGMRIQRHLEINQPRGSAVREGAL